MPVNRYNAEKYVDDLYLVFLGRQPQPKEKQHWIDQILGGMSDRRVFDLFKQSKEFASRTRIKPAYPAGHYYSPVVDPDEAREYFAAVSTTVQHKLNGLDVSTERILSTWERLRPFVRTTNFPTESKPPRRYYLTGFYHIGDAAILRSMILAEKPKRIIEIGSGFSSACMLDAIEEGEIDAHLTCIEPYPERLRSLLRAGDSAHCTVIEQPVQSVGLQTFRELEKGDILFIDSTHVLKTASDVHYELFEILPTLADGVLVHFHDIHYPFEYPAAWVIEQQLSWNEIYAVRAFLMYNSKFDIVFFNSMFAVKFRNQIEDTYPGMLLNPGGSLWIRKNDSSRQLSHT